MKKILIILLFCQFGYTKDLQNLYSKEHIIHVKNKKEYADMYKYIYTHDNQKLKQLLDKGLNPNVVLPIKLSYTPLYYATLRKNIDTIKLLISYGADINLISPSNDEGKFSTTALSIAVAENNFQLTKFLLDNKATINIKSTNIPKLICNKKETVIPPLFYSYTKEMLELLISKGGNIYQKNLYGETILDWYVGATKIKKWAINRYKLPTKYIRCGYYGKIIKVEHTESGYKEYDINGTIVYEYNATK